MSIDLIDKCQCCLMKINAKDCLEISRSIRKCFFDFTSIELLTSEKLSSKICFGCKDVISKSTMAKKSLIAKQKKLLEFLEQMEMDEPEGVLVKREAGEDLEGLEFFQPFIETKTEENDPEVAKSNPEMKASSRLPPYKQSKRFKKPKHKPGARLFTVRNKHKCDECDFECVNKRSMDRHRYENHECQIGALTLSTTGELVRLNGKQEKLKHLRLNRKQGARTYIIRNTHKCSKCEFECVNKRSMDRHLYENRHKGAKSSPPLVIMCEICSKEFRDRALFNRHLDRHNNVKRFFCDMCGFGTHARQDLRSHMLTHLKDDPRVIFKCDYEGCSGVYRTPASLRRHKRAYHQKLRPFACNTCSKSFATKLRLTDHIRFVHQKLRPHSCDVENCGLTFAYKSHVVRHKRLIHQIVVEKKEGFLP